MKAEEMWNEYKNNNKAAGNEYQAWCFGADADLLAKLVVNGEKTATASAFPLYEAEKEPLPYVGQYNIILNSMGEAVCITRTTKVSITPFEEVSSLHAYKEGEGDKSLRYWRKVHEEFFIKEMKGSGKEFNHTMNVVCEEFEVVFS